MSRPARILEWVHRCFGVHPDHGPTDRATRLLEEAIEVAQAAGVSQARAHAVLVHVYSRPAGELAQEIGGVGVCAEALAELVGTSLEAETQTEWERICAHTPEHFTRRHQAKADAGIARQPKERGW